MLSENGSLDIEFAGPTPQLAVSNTSLAVAFYRDVFSADELLRHHGADDAVIHSELLLNGGRMLVHDDVSKDIFAPTELGGTTVRLHVYVPDVDDVYRRALAHGALGRQEPHDVFWGDRYAIFQDPFGHLWSVATVQCDLSPGELAERVARRRTACGSS